MEDLRRIVKERLRELNMTQCQLAEKMGIKPPTLSNMLQRKKNRVETIIKLNEILGLNIKIPINVTRTIETSDINLITANLLTQIQLVYPKTRTTVTKTEMSIEIKIEFL